MTRERPAKYTPLLYTTTIRNPERVKDFMHILYRYNGQILTDELITQFECDTFKVGLYRPMRRPASVANKWRTAKKGELSSIALTDVEARLVADMNDSRLNPSIKGHKEAGYDWGWPSRFDTQFKLMKRLGFVYYNMNEPIFFSEPGRFIAETVKIDIEGEEVTRNIVHPEYEQKAFLQAMVKEQRCNPFIKELNDNVPLILLLQTIKLINNDPDYGNCGVTKKEIPLFIFWKDNDANALYQRIKLLRQTYGYSPSDEVIQDICINEIMGGFKEFDLESIVHEYPDDYIRKMRLTGLISLRGGGRFIDINHNEDEKIQYILSNYSTYRKFEQPREYFNYVSSIDNRLFDISTTQVSETQSSKYLADWVDHYGWDNIKHELNNLSDKRPSTDDILKFIPSPARLEFLIAIAIKARLPQIKVIPNYTCDDTGLPTSTAGGNQADIECYERPNAILVEVTMAEGRQQTVMEIWPIVRHLEQFKENNNPNSQCVFVAPSIFIDSDRQINYSKDILHHYIRPYKINDFVDYLEQAQNLYETAV